MVTQSNPATPTEKLRAYARELLARTKAREINWIIHPRHGRPPETPYELVLPRLARLAHLRSAIYSC